MAHPIGQRELRNDNAEIMRRVEAGEMFLVTRNGKPVADLVRWSAGSGETPVPAGGTCRSPRRRQCSGSRC